MSNNNVYIVVEGQTEQTFIRDVLVDYMAYKGIYLHASLISTSSHKGGNYSLERKIKDILMYNPSYFFESCNYFLFCSIMQLR